MVIGDHFIPMRVTENKGRRSPYGPPKSKFVAKAFCFHTWQIIPDADAMQRIGIRFPTSFKYVEPMKADPQMCWVVDEKYTQYPNAYCMWGHMIDDVPEGWWDD